MSRLTGQIGRRARPLSTALLLFDLWRRLPPKYRKKLLAQVRKHGPRLARQAIRSRRKHGR